MAMQDELQSQDHLSRPVRKILPYFELNTYLDLYYRRMNIHDIMSLLINYAHI